MKTLLAALFTLVVACPVQAAPLKNDNPTHTLQMVIASVRQNNVHTLMNLLSGEALDFYGNYDGLATLRSNLNKSQLDIGMPEATASEEFETEYSVNVFRKEFPSYQAFSASVNCGPSTCTVSQISF